MKKINKNFGEVSCEDLTSALKLCSTISHKNPEALPVLAEIGKATQKNAPMISFIRKMVDASAANTGCKLTSEERENNVYALAGALQIVCNGATIAIAK